MDKAAHGQCRIVLAQSRIVSNGILSIIMEIAHIGGAGKGVLQNISNRRADVEGVETGTIAESPVADESNRIGDAERGDGTASFEGDIADGGYGGA